MLGIPSFALILFSRTVKGHVPAPYIILAITVHRGIQMYHGVSSGAMRKAAMLKNIMIE